MLHTSVTLPAPLCAPRGTRLEIGGWKSNEKKFILFCMLMEGFWEEIPLSFF